MAKKDFNGDMFIEGISDYIVDLFKKIPDEWKADIAVHISVEAAVQGANSAIQGVGILEVAKIIYHESVLQITNEE